MEPYVNLITAIASFIIVIRLSTFRGCGHKRKLGISFIAWIAIITAGAQGIAIIFFEAPVTFSNMVLTLVSTFLVMRVKGNISCLLRVKNELD